MCRAAIISSNLNCPRARSSRASAACSVSPCKRSCSITMFLYLRRGCRAAVTLPVASRVKAALEWLTNSYYFGEISQIPLIIKNSIFRTSNGKFFNSSNIFQFLPEEIGRNSYLPVSSGCPGRNTFLPEEKQPCLSVRNQFWIPRSIIGLPFQSINRIGLEDRNVTNIITHPIMWIFLQSHFKQTTWENIYISVK